MEQPAAVTVQAFRAMARRTPEERAEARKKVEVEIEGLKARGVRLVVNPTGHRGTLSASGPVPGSILSK